MYGHIHHHFPRAPQELLAQLEGVWTSTIADTMGRHGVMMPEIRPIFEPIRMVGVAFTVLNYPNDNITTHKALTMLQPGDVLVIDEGRENNTGSFGHNMSLQARNRGIAGFVSNGCMRDIRLLREEKFPAFCRGVCPRSAQKNTPGSINVPVQV
ncbi:MAG: RraA family protein, partial [Betaproteobacteria bacterium]|nr:RraA family protein [Betaproteobacteria bacterium]